MKCTPQHNTCSRCRREKREKIVFCLFVFIMQDEKWENCYNAAVVIGANETSATDEPQQCHALKLGNTFHGQS